MCFQGWTETKDTPNILSENEMRDFWISWKDKKISVGTGLLVGENIVMERSEDADWYEINAVSFSSMMGVDAVFELPDDPGKIDSFMSHNCLSLI